MLFHHAKIGKYAFSSCKKLQKVEILSDSKLQIIDDNAFFDSRIKSIKIPSNATWIGANAFSLCYNLQRVEMPADSKL